MSPPGFLLVILATSLWLGDSRFIADPLPLISQESLTLDTCPECSQVIQLSANMISGSDTKVSAYETLHGLCQRLPEDQASECESQVKTYLPKVLQPAPGHLKPEEMCVVFGLCAPSKKEGLEKLPHRVTSEHISSSALGTSANTQELFNPVCTMCLMIIKKLETLLPKNMTEETLKKIMGEVCELIPKSYKERCDDFVEKYGVQIVEFLLSSAAPHTICTLLHLCLFEEQPVPEVLYPSDCESCQTLAALSRLHLGLNATESQLSGFLQSVCDHHPNAVPKCDAFIRIYGSQLQRILGNQMDVSHPCEKTDLCNSSKMTEPLGKNPCTWGASYWCKDPETAHKCDKWVFCEKFMWKN
ncbi:surfactant protein Bb [Cololabis saira]|uniref:surfactant protein Bb n=1 Tax=Cololabis saira TaxID=129043 RepID=UPI002AD4181A|nr:surfactant protein Bb [Cololabis saira]